MNGLTVLLVLIPALPLAAAVVTPLLGPRLLRERSHLPAVVAVGLACLLSLTLLWRVNGEAKQAAAAERNADGQRVGFEYITNPLWTWASVDGGGSGGGAAAVGGPRIEIVLRADPLTAVMLAMVTFVSLLVVIYSVGYMHGDPGYWRFFTYVSLFVFSMTMLVSVSSFLLLYVFWEAVGLCSYLLIGFWFQRPAAAAAGKKAFLVNRVGDFGLALGVFLLWTTYGSLDFHDTAGVPGVLGQLRLADPGRFVGGGLGLAICLLLLAGAIGKSAQFPLHVWLPDAMEGPSPVSALIHAATMVTAGVYLVARCAPLFFASYSEPFEAGGLSIDAPTIVALIGCLTALLAAVMALSQHDLKRVLAYSTISQLGYMFLALGAATLAGFVGGMFHLFTHAFFKALLFLGAGSVMHAMGGVIDMRQFGGLRRRLPTTNRTFFIGCLALAGIVPLAGFFSKDAILAAVHERHDPAGLFHAFYWVALVTALITAFYTFRAYFLTFCGEERIPPEAHAHAHEAGAPMRLPLVVLATCAAVAGFWQRGFGDLLALTPSLAYVELHQQHAAVEEGSHLAVAGWSTLFALTGMGTAAFLYLGNRRELAWISGLRLLRPLYLLSYRQFFIDAVYRVFVVWPLLALARWADVVDRWVVDRLIDFVGKVPSILGSQFRALQNGLVQFYALGVVLGVLVLIGALAIWPPG